MLFIGICGASGSGKTTPYFNTWSEMTDIR